MGVHERSEKFSVDIEGFRTSAATALRRWAQKRSIAARRLLAREFNLSPQTIDDWLHGRNPIPTEYLIQLPSKLGFAFTAELFDALMENNERETLQRILHRYLQLIQEEHPHGNAPVDCHHRFDCLRGIAVPSMAEV